MKNFNKDIMEWTSFPEYDILWTDPPWEEKMVRFFQTQMKKDTGLVVAHTLRDIIYKLGELASKEKPLVINYSVKGTEEIIFLLQGCGHIFLKCSTNPQEKNNPFPFNTLIFNKNLKLDLSEVGFYKIITNTLKKTSYKVLFDPFAGTGKSCAAVKKAGLIYIGSELNPARFKKLLVANP